MSAAFFQTIPTGFKIARRAVVGGLLLVPFSRQLHSETILPTPGTLPFVDTQVREIESIILNRQAEKILANRYLASSVYYSDAFCRHVMCQSNQVDVPTRIVGRIGHLMTPEVRSWSAESLKTLGVKEAAMCGKSLSCDERKPLGHFAFGQGANHTDAIDLFTHEGSSVYAFADGVVILADASWQPGDEYSSASMKGGNTVIVFSPMKHEFYRYAHLQTVAVQVGQLVLAGDTLGVVGHTGKNASLAGHGGHLHFEINAYNVSKCCNTVVTAGELHRRLVSVI